MTPTITAFKVAFDKGQGLARDMRVRWALEEVGQPYDVRLVAWEDFRKPAHLALNPFGQIPTWEEDGLTLFETGSIVLRIAETRSGLLPSDAGGRARAVTWMFAAVNTVEPPILEFQNAVLLEADKPWTEERLPGLKKRIRDRMDQLAAYLGDAEWLEGDFTAGDLMMVHALLRLRPSGLLAENAVLSAYCARGEARPAYRRAFEAQRAVYEAATAES